MQAKIEQCFKGTINGVNIYNCYIYFALKSILQSVEKSNHGINTNHKGLTEKLYARIRQKEFHTTPTEFEDWTGSLCRELKESNPVDICKILNVYFGI